MSSEVDGHVHSHYSDGSDTPTIVAKNAAKAGLKAVCLTDHDCVRGTDEFLREADQLGLFTVPSTELSTMFDEAELHIIGYNIDHRNKAFLNGLLPVNQMRSDRSILVIQNVARILGIPCPDIRKVRHFTDAKSSYIAFHVIRDYFHYVHQVNYDEIIKMTSRGGRAHVSYNVKYLPTPVSLVKFIYRHGGKAVFAHPGEFLRRIVRKFGESVAREKFISLIKQLVAAGLTGIEVHCHKHDSHETELFLRIANEFNLEIFSGSDNHGRFTPHMPMGIGNMTVDQFQAFLNK